MEFTKRQQKLKELIKDKLEAEMSWLRSIDMNDEKDIRRAALELIMSRKNSITNQSIKEIFGS